MKIYDISQEIFSCRVYPGDPAPERKVLCSTEKGELYNLTAFSMCAHNGTHIDAPYHFIKDGKTVDEIPLEAFVGMAFAAEHHGVVTGDDAAKIISENCPYASYDELNDIMEKIPDSLGELKARFADEKRVFMLDATLNACEVKGYISRLKLLITARTHASIAAYSTCVPTLVIGYSIKARGIARDLFGDEASHLIPAQELDSSAQLIEAYDALYERAEDERLYLKRKLPEYIGQLDRAVQAIVSLG